MKKSQFRRKLQENINKIVKEYKPEKIIHYGSSLKQLKKDSDVDIFIIKKGVKKSLGRSFLLRKKIDFSLPLDILIYTPEEVERSLKWEDPFITNILKKGKILYG